MRTGKGKGRTTMRGDRDDVGGNINVLYLLLWYLLGYKLLLSCISYYLLV